MRNVPAGDVTSVSGWMPAPAGTSARLTVGSVVGAARRSGMQHDAAHVAERTGQTS